MACHAAWGLGLLLMLALPAQAVLPLDQVRAGMKGYGLTVFSGETIERFQVEILGTLRGIAPGADAVLARLSGGPLERTGVFEGMSGSPVYLDGKLLGAVFKTVVCRRIHR